MNLQSTFYIWKWLCWNVFLALNVDLTLFLRQRYLFCVCYNCPRSSFDKQKYGLCSSCQKGRLHHQALLRWAMITACITAKNWFRKWPHCGCDSLNSISNNAHIFFCFGLIWIRFPLIRLLSILVNQYSANVKGLTLNVVVVSWVKEMWHPYTFSI